LTASSRPARAVSLSLLLILSLIVGACAGTATTTPSPEPSAAATAAATPAPTESPAEATPTADFPVTLVDDEGTTVEIPARPERIVSLTPASTEILFETGAGDRVIATTDFDDYPPEAVDLPDVASYTAVDVEKIVGLDADLVIAGGNFFNDPEAIARLRTLGVPVVVTYAPDIATVLHDIELIGTATGQVDEATELAASMRSAFDAVGAATAGLDRPRVFYELDATSAIYTAADDSFIEEMIELAGGDPITTGSPTSFEISLERLIEADPELILLGDAAYGVTPEAVKERNGWGVMTAVREDRIVPVDDIIVTRPGPRLVEGLRALVAAIHPDVTVP
jgi:iron complex transport system substrate-binding protein